MKSCAYFHIDSGLFICCNKGLLATQILGHLEESHGEEKTCEALKNDIKTAARDLNDFRLQKYLKPSQFLPFIRGLPTTQGLTCSECWWSCVSEKHFSSHKCPSKKEIRTTLQHLLPKPKLVYFPIDICSSKSNEDLNAILLSNSFAMTDKGKKSSMELILNWKDIENEDNIMLASMPDTEDVFFAYKDYLISELTNWITEFFKTSYNFLSTTIKAKLLSGLPRYISIMV